MLIFLLSIYFNLIYFNLRSLTEIGKLNFSTGKIRFLFFQQRFFKLQKFSQIHSFGCGLERLGGKTSFRAGWADICFIIS